MIKGILTAALAIWAAWSLGLLSADLQRAAAQDAALEAALDDTRRAIEALQQQAPEDHLRSLGYIYRGDMVFFDGG